MQIRVMTIEDIPKAISLWQSCDGVGLSDADEPAALAAFLSRNPSISCVVESNDEVVAAALGGHDGRRGFLYHVAVRSELRRQGLGRALVRNALARMRDAGVFKCHVMVFRSNRAGHAFWSSVGFHLRDDLDVCSQMTAGAEC